MNRLQPGGDDRSAFGSTKPCLGTSRESWNGAALAEGEAAGRPVREHHRADHAAPGHRSPRARVAGVSAVIAEDEVVARRNPRPAERLIEPYVDPSLRGYENGRLM